MPRAGRAGRASRASLCRASRRASLCLAGQASSRTASVCENFLYGFKAAPRGRSRRRLGTAQPRSRSAPARLASGARSAGAKGNDRGRGNPGKSRSRGGFDTGTPRGGSIGLMRATWEGRPIAGKRTAAAPVSNPPLRQLDADPFLPHRTPKPGRRRQAFLDESGGTERPGVSGGSDSPGGSVELCQVMP